MCRHSRCSRSIAHSKKDILSQDETPVIMSDLPSLAASTGPKPTYRLYCLTRPESAITLLYLPWHILDTGCTLILRGVPLMSGLSGYQGGSLAHFHRCCLITSIDTLSYWMVPA